MVIWRGFGIVVPVISLAIIAAIIYLFKALGANEELFIKQDWPVAVGMIINGLILVPLGCRMNGRKVKELVEFDSRFTDDIFDGEHSFFFVAVEYWGVLSFLLAVILFVKQLVAWV